MKLTAPPAIIFPTNGGDQPIDDRKQFQEYKVLAEKGHAYAWFFVGNAYLEGKGVEKDSAKGVQWYRKAAEQDVALAQESMGTFYANGTGVAKDLKEAAKWHRKAAEQNREFAQESLGMCYFLGEGVVQDFVEAYAWLKLASDTNPFAAQINFDDLLKAKAFKPEQIAAGKKRAKELRSQIDAKLKSGGR